MSAPLRWVDRPAILAELPHDRHVVIEASAGTGKTYTIEHLLADWLLRGEASIDQLLVVTFTDKATAELRTRVRRLLEQLATPAPTGGASEYGGASEDSGASDYGDATALTSRWLLDEVAQERVRRALFALDTATISTIHGFCQRVLTEHPFASGQPFEPTLVDGRSAFDTAWREALRRDLAHDPALVPWLGEQLAAGRKLETLSALLYECLSDRASLRPHFDPQRLAAALASLQRATAEPALVDVVRRLLKQVKVHASTIKAVTGRIERLVELVGELAPSVLDGAATVRDPQVAAALARFLGRLEQLDGKGASGRREGVLTYLGEQLGAAASEEPMVRRFVDALHALDSAAVSLDAAFVALTLPVVARQLDGHKRRSEQYDFDDMLLRVRDALVAGPHADSLLPALRARYRVGLVDEFQDTNEVQWSIFRTLFDVDAARSEQPVARPLYLVGDPKQSIYGFRGADLATYLRARGEVVASGGARVTLRDNYRSTSWLIDGCNQLLDSAAATPLFTPPNEVGAPVRCGRRERLCVDAQTATIAAPIALLELGEEAATLKADALRAHMAERIGDEIVALLDGALSVGSYGGEPLAIGAVTPLGATLRSLRPGDIFVLTRTRAEAEAVAEALLRRHVPHVLAKQDGLFQTDEARWLQRLLGAVELASRTFALDHGAEGVEPYLAAAMQAALTPLLARGPFESDRLVPPDEPTAHHLAQLLLRWGDLAAERDYERLFPELLAESRLHERLGDDPTGERCWLDVVQLCELLLELGAGRRLALRELIAELEGWIAARIPLPGARADARRAARASDAVQLLTVHKAKGLEAEVVFLASDLVSSGRGATHLFHDGLERCRYIGPIRDTTVEAAVRRESALEDERLLYVALTRARSRLYLPWVPTGAMGGAMGGTTALQRRLDALLDEGSPLLVRRAPAGVAPRLAECEAERVVRWADTSATQRQTAATNGRTGEGWLAATALERSQRDRARGPRLLSYTRLVAERPLDARDEVVPEVEPAEAQGWLDDDGAEQLDGAEQELPPNGDDPLRGGSEIGILIHALLEQLPWSTLSAPISFEDWCKLDAVAACWRRHLDRPLPTQASAPAAPLGGVERERAQRIVYGTLLQPLQLQAAGLIEQLAAARRPQREVELFYPVTFGGNGSYVWGFVDLIFTGSDGRVYFADWKTDRLARWDADALAAHVDERYALQLRLYLVAIVKQLGVRSAVDYDARFGGALYCFVRAMEPDAAPNRGVHIVRPTWQEVSQWLERPIP